MRKILIPFAICISLITSVGCTPYQIDVRQGNSADRDDFLAIRTGMTKQQVEFLLGTALIKDPFHPNRWDYVYTFQPGGGEMRAQHLTLFFENDELIKIDDAAVDIDSLPNPVK